MHPSQLCQLCLIDSVIIRHAGQCTVCRRRAKRAMQMLRQLNSDAHWGQKTVIASRTGSRAVQLLQDHLSAVSCIEMNI
ncbi:hypothetical protein B5X24_HaOG202173 [Helicoverpa armigera]|uniref:Uncharacterized protein n=1 Tax=Helicoverpa armigera TaxID=29058 RepID=A0A2W1BTT8_HELAM|nr:hypothetical protein B5X24_HaOG202173 [Helicoverpa armigera]